MNKQATATKYLEVMVGDRIRIVAPESTGGAYDKGDEAIVTTVYLRKEHSIDAIRARFPNGEEPLVYGREYEIIGA